MSDVNDDAAGNGAGPASDPENMDFGMLQEQDENFPANEENESETSPIVNEIITGNLQTLAAGNVGAASDPFSQSYTSIQQELITSSEDQQIVSNFEPMVSPKRRRLPPVPPPLPGPSYRHYPPIPEPPPLPHRSHAAEPPEPPPLPRHIQPVNPPQPPPLPHHIQWVDPPEPPPLPHHVQSVGPPEPPPLPHHIQWVDPPEPPPLPHRVQPVDPPEIIPGPILPNHILPTEHPNIPWLKIPRELTPAGVAEFAKIPWPKESYPYTRKLTIEKKYFTPTIPYCNMGSKLYSQSQGIIARRVAIPWRIPTTVPCAELRRAVELMNPFVRRGILDLKSRESYRMTHQLFKTQLTMENQVLIMKWSNIAYPSLTSKIEYIERDNEMKELQMLFGLTADAQKYICSDIRALYKFSYIERIRHLKKTLYPSWNLHEVSEIWRVYSADRTNEGMYDEMYSLLKGRRNHRSIMRMLEFIVYCEKNPGMANPNMRDAFTSAVIPDAGAPSNPMDDVEMRTLLELREYYGPMNDWDGLSDSMSKYAHRFSQRRRELNDLKDLYIRQGLDYIKADEWTKVQDGKLQMYKATHGDDWERIARTLNRTAHAVMARSLFLDNEIEVTANTGAGPSNAGAGPSNT